MASILKVDDLRGNTAAGDITITSEGGSATMQLQQGLTKQFLTMGSDYLIDDSFNTSSLTDNATGDFTITYNNNFSTALGIALSGASGFSRVTLSYGPGTAPNTTTSTIRCGTVYAYGTGYTYYDSPENGVLSTGDLA